MDVDNNCKDVCKYFIETGICTLGSNCTLHHDRCEFRKQQQIKVSNTNNDDDTKTPDNDNTANNDSDMTEICFSFDTTGSMYQWLEEVKSKLKDIVHNLFNTITNLRVAFIAHGDYCDAASTYVIKHIPFSTDANAIVNWIQNAQQTGGGDWPECYEFSMYTAARFHWSRYAQNKALVIIGDATPHSADYAENTLNIDWREELDRLCMKGIKIYGIHCGGSSTSKYFYDTISRRSGGTYLTLANMKNISNIFVALCLRSSDQQKFEAFSEQIMSAQNTDKELQNALKQLKATESNASAVKRLMHDLREIQREKLQNIAVVPDESDVFKWHLNIQPLQGALQSVYIHIILQFPAQYPARPPNITLHSYFMNDIHPNIMDNAICMDVLRSNIGMDGSAGSKYGGWTAAYSITSLLVNISSLFCDITTHNDDDDDIEMGSFKHLTQNQMNELIKRIRNTDCECGHSHHVPYPPLPCNMSPIDLVCDDSTRATISGTIIQTKIEDEYCKIKSLFAIQLHHKCVAWTFTLDWFDVQQSGFIMGFADQTGNFFGINHIGCTIYKNIMDESKRIFAHEFKQNDTISYILYLNTHRIFIAINDEYIANVALPNDYSTITHFYPLMYLQNIRLKLSFETNHVLNALPSKYSLPFKQVHAISQLPEISGFATISKRQVYVTQEQWNALLEMALSSDVLLIIYSCLVYEDISRCKQINTHWHSTIVSHLVLERISTNCYFSGDAWTDDTLGVGLYVQFEGQSSWIKTAKTEMDLLSLTAWNEYNVREGAWGEPLTHFLPLIVNENHAQRAMPELMNRIRMLCKAETFTEDIALVALSTLMNQFVVQLMGDVDDVNVDLKHASEKALIGYCAFHHLLLYLSNEFPLMRLIAHRKVNDFIENYTKRSKTYTPDLGKFLVHLAIIDEVNWKDIGKAFIDESLDRSVKWYLKKYGKLEDMKEDGERLETVFNATQTGRRLILFQHWFIQSIARPQDKSLSAILNDYNKTWGKPTDEQKKRLMQCVKNILNHKSDYKHYNWMHYFKDLGLECFESNAQIVNVLKESVIRSALKGYHRKSKMYSASAEYKAIASNIHQIELRQRTMLTDCPNKGPMARLKHMMDEQRDVMLIMRVTERQCKKVVGKIKAFDRHWNMIMLNAKEYWRSQICYSKHNPVFVDKDRVIARYVFVRGDDIISVRILELNVNKEMNNNNVVKEMCNEEDLIELEVD
eukprot:27159_1